MAKQYLLRSEVLKRVDEIWRKAKESGDKTAAEVAEKAHNAVMSTPVERRIFCQHCGEKLDKAGAAE